MVWFYCDACGDSIKKPKLANHFRMCDGHHFTCVDCSRSFDRATAQGHNTCVSEHEKYALGATKPGGFAAQGFFNDAASAPPTAAAGGGAKKGSDEPFGLEFLSQRPPWKCSCCGVSCTSQETLLGHAAGVKHKRRARAALGLTGQQQQQQQQQQAGAAAEAEAAAAGGTSRQAEEPQQEAAAAAEQEQEQEQEPREKTRKQEAEGKAKKKGKEKKAAKQQCPGQEAERAEQQQAAGEGQARALEDGKGKQEKKKQKQKQRDQQQRVQQQEVPDLAPLLKAARKQLKKKGQLRLKKLEALLKETANGGFSADMLVAVKEQLLASSKVQLRDNKTLQWAGSGDE